MIQLVFLLNLNQVLAIYFKEEEAKHESTKHNLNLTCRLGYVSVTNQQRCIFVTNMLFSAIGVQLGLIRPLRVFHLNGKLCVICKIVACTNLSIKEIKMHQININ